MFVCDSRLAWLKQWLINHDILLRSNAYCAYPELGEFGEVDFEYLNNVEDFQNVTVVQ